MKFIWLLPLLLVGCASQQLTHNYSGDVHLQRIVVDLQPLTGANDEDKSLLAKLGEIQRVVQAIEDAMDDEETARLIEQLTQFEQIMFDGVRNAAGIPLVKEEAISVTMQHGDQNELINITWKYPEYSQDYLTLHASVDYPYMETTSMGFGLGTRSETYKVEPAMTVDIRGHLDEDRLFWDQSVRYSSSKSFTVGTDYVLGIATDRIEDADVFLIPLAEGFAKQLRKDLKK